MNTTIEEDEIHIAVYSCDAGYYLDSNETRECEREIGQWTSSPPACICELNKLFGSIDVYNALIIILYNPSLTGTFGEHAKFNTTTK